ncbi:MAG: hemerythrin domain-containing protein [Candidatus Dormibacteraceae bacterium]
MNRSRCRIRPALDLLLSTTQEIRANAECVARELPGASTVQLARSLGTLTDQLVSDLLPLLDAEEQVVCNRLDAELCDALKTHHREVRRLTEQMAMLSENVERSLRRTPEAKPVLRALREAITSLDALGIDQRTATCRLEEILSIDDQGRLTEGFQAAAAAARRHTMLIVQPAVPPTASTVLRRRPDLDTAYAISLADIEPRSTPRGGPRN